MRISLAMLALSSLGLTSCGDKGSPYRGPGLPADRKALFTYLVDKTLEREAFSPVKNKHLALNFEKQAALLEEEFLAADSDLKLYRALFKLSNLRKDRHLRIEPIQDGLRPNWGTRELPIRFSPDFAQPDKPQIFVQRVALNADLGGRRRPAAGDRLLAVNGHPVEKYFAMMRPYLNHSTQAGLLLQFTEALSLRNELVGEELYRPIAQLDFEDGDGNTYRSEIKYASGGGPFAARFNYRPVNNRTFPGFHKQFETAAYALYLSPTNANVLLLDWRGFPGSLAKDLKKLMSYAGHHKLLDHDLIVDATHSQGGSRGADVVARMASKPFKTTFGNVRCSDVIPRFTKRYSPFSSVGSWLRNEVAKACAEGKAYADPVPFKLAHLPKESDGMMSPADVRFRGNLVCLFGPLGGSHLDQFAAMIIDNHLGHTIGLPTGGFSNTWEWEEDVVFPTSKERVIRFMWSIGHTLRPNGEILEGNPAKPVERVPLTQKNFERYYDLLLERALEHLTKIR